MAPLHVVFLVLPGTQLLDLAGPADVFVAANECARELGHEPAAEASDYTMQGVVEAIATANDGMR